MIAFEAAEYGYGKKIKPHNAGKRPAVD